MVRPAAVVLSGTSVPIESTQTPQPTSSDAVGGSTPIAEQTISVQEDPPVVSGRILASGTRLPAPRPTSTYWSRSFTPEATVETPTPAPQPSATSTPRRAGSGEAGQVQRTMSPTSRPTRTPSSTATATTQLPLNGRGSQQDARSLGETISTLWDRYALVGVLAFLLIGGAFDSVFAAPNVRKRLLVRHARRDYGSARGTRHKSVIVPVLKDLEAQIASHAKAKTRAEAKLRELQRRQDAALLSAATDYVVKTRLTEVPGIGKKLSQAIYSEIYRGKLEHLHRAHTLTGISETKQQAINRWVQKYKRELPFLAKQSFKGRQAVLDRYAPKRRQIQQEIDEVTREIQRLSNQKAELERHVQYLLDVNANSFIDRLLHLASPTDTLDQYLEGAYPPWRDTPKWYVEVESLEKKLKR